MNAGPKAGGESPLEDYALVTLDPKVASIANNYTTSLIPRFASARTGVRGGGSGVIASGDIVNVTIFEASPGGLFISGDPNGASARGGNYVQIPPQQVDAAGKIEVPYAGSMRVAGLSPMAAAAQINAKLANRAIDPQTVVTIGERRGVGVSVLGDMNSPGSFAIEQGGLSVLTALAKAGGSKYPDFETVLTLQRGGRTDKALVSAIVRDPKQDIQLLAGDVVYASREEQVFLVFGATPSPGAIGGQNNRRFPFDKENVTLAESIAKAGGLSDVRADPKAVFLFRFEKRDVLSRLGTDVSRYTTDLVPTVYSLDFSGVDGYMLASGFYLRNRDIIFVSDAPATDLMKFLNVVRGVTAPAADISTVVNSGN